MAGEVLSGRVDAWIWAVRMVKTRSLAAEACKGGHVKVNGVRAKPAQAVKIGDEVRVRVEGWERVLVVKKIINKRVGPPVAVECYEDNSPPPPARESMVAVRDRGAGRPTKRERRSIEKLFGRYAQPPED